MADFSVLKDRLEKSGLTGNAAEWLLKAINPATPGASGILIPDASCDPVATPETVVSVTIPPFGGSNWDCLILKPPTYPLLAIVVTGPAGADFTNTWAGFTVTVVQTEPGTSSHDVVGQYQNYVMGAAHSGSVQIASLSPSTYPAKWRATARSATEYLVASDLYNQGTVTSGQYPPRIKQYKPWVVYGTPPDAYNYSFETLQVPLNEADMTVLNPKVRVAPAKQGVYQPIYNGGPTFQWATARELAASGTDVAFGTGTGSGVLFYPASSQQTNPQAPAATPTLIAPLDTTNDLALESWMYGAQINWPAAANNPYSWGTSNELCGVSIYRGLSNNASITLKMVLAMEIVPTPTSPIRQFVKTAADCEPRAIQLYYDLIRDLPQSYPSSSNFLGAVLTAARTLLPQLLPHIPGAIDAVSSAFGGPRIFAPMPTVEPTGKREAQPEMAASSRSRPPPDRAVVAPSMTRARRRKVKVAPARRATSASSTRSRRSVRIAKPRRR